MKTIHQRYGKGHLLCNMARIGTHISWLQGRGFSVTARARLRGVRGKLARQLWSNPIDQDITGKVTQMEDLNIDLNICTRILPGRLSNLVGRRRQGDESYFGKSRAWEMRSHQIVCLKNWQINSPGTAFKGDGSSVLCHWFEFADLGPDLLIGELRRELSFKQMLNNCLKDLSFERMLNN